MKLLAALVLPALLTLGVAYAGSRVVGGPPRSSLRAEGFVWGKRTYPNRAAFARWLDSRGRSYEVWASRHPAPLPAKAAKSQSSDGGLSPGASAAAYGGVIFVAVAGIGLRIRRRRRWRARRGLLRSGRLSYARAHSLTLVAWHDHPDLAWYVAGGALVAGAALVITSWT